MDMGVRLELSQKLIMTPELRQALSILQLPALELSAVIEQELVDNPVLDAECPSELPDNADLADSWSERMHSLVEYLREDNNYNAVGGEPVAREYPLERTVHFTASLAQYLELQLDLIVKSGLRHSVGQYIIGCLNDHGYLTQSTAEIAKKLNTTPALVEDVLADIQSFDPAGVGARSLKECLTIQLQRRELAQPEVFAIINGYLDEVAEARYHFIADQLQISLHTVHEAVKVIRTLNPKPGLNFVSPNQPSGYIAADVTVKLVDNDFIILLENQPPQLTLNKFYLRMIAHGEAETRKYLQAKIHAAEWLIKSIDQRNRTLYKVTEAITKLQRDFFVRGIRWLQPLTLKEVADYVGIHESTVSRAIANKYVNTPFGLFSFKTFFSAGISSSQGFISSIQIKQRIKKLVETEDVAQPLSDQKIVEVLKNEGIVVARRTVAKYREELGILSAKKRKRI